MSLVGATSCMIAGILSRKVTHILIQFYAALNAVALHHAQQPTHDDLTSKR